jgi:hypothetical protein
LYPCLLFNYRRSCGGLAGSDAGGSAQPHPAQSRPLPHTSRQVIQNIRPEFGYCFQCLEVTVFDKFCNLLFL